MTTGERIAKARKRFLTDGKECTQEKLAEMSGLHRTYISDIERFQRSISLSNVSSVIVIH